MLRSFLPILPLLLFCGTLMKWFQYLLSELRTISVAQNPVLPNPRHGVQTPPRSDTTFFTWWAVTGTSSLQRWMAHHPALRWVSKVRTASQKAAEAHVFDTRDRVSTDPTFRRNGRGEHNQNAPRASVTDRVIDCKRGWRSSYRIACYIVLQASRSRALQIPATASPHVT